MIPPKQIYLNRAQAYLYNLQPNSATIIAARRLGKTKGMIPFVFLRNIHQMPGGTHGVIGRTYNQMLSKILPNTLSMLNDLGYKQGVHFFVGRKAPRNMNFREPKVPPLVWDYCIHWFNGSVNMLISQDVKFSANSLTLSSLVADEARALDSYKLEDEVIAALTPMFHDCPWDMSQYYFSDLPRRQSEKFLFEHKRKHNEDLITLLEDAVLRIAKGLNVRNNTIYRDEYRKRAWLYKVFDVFDNIEVLGEEYVRTKLRDLSPSVFIAQLLSEDIRDPRGKFYADLSEQHYYIANNNSEINNMVRSSYGDIEVSSLDSFTWKTDGDINQTAPLLIALDTNININWLVVGQADYDQRSFKTLNSFFVKSPELLPDVVKDFCKYYQSYPHKDVCFYYDHTLKQGKSATSTEAFYQTVVRVLLQEGWNVTEIYIGHAMSHKDRHLVISQCLRRELATTETRGKVIQYLYPTFNKENNEVLITSMETVGTKRTAKGWGKDKSGEKLADDELNPVQYRTDGSEAWDMLFLGSLLKPWTDEFSTFSLGITTF